MRGIPFAFAPTTLLAQVDASIGGKNGVNSGPFKNMIGVFNQPEFVLIDTGFLATLSDEEYANGLAEVIKHCAIHNAKEFGWLVSHMDRILQRDPENVERTVLQSVFIKTLIVDSDPLEKDQRRLLNYGHTYGHAIEIHYGIAHGRAVSLGIVLANKVAVESGLLEEKKARYITTLLTDAGLPTDISHLDMTALNILIRDDKKKVGDKVAFILLKDIGEPIIEMIPLYD
jgi:3-dehydroquinate synthase